MTRQLTAQVSAAMKMPAGGMLRVGPGQITDDSEMALCLAHALTGHEASQLQGAAAEMYVKWLNSKPFDIGATTRNALSAGLYAQQKGESKSGIASSMVTAAAATNMGSKANGALMRITPLAVWGHKLSQHDLVQAVQSDAQLTHPNKTCLDCNACYCIAIAHLINNPGDAQGSVKEAEDWATAHATEEVNEWLTASSQHGCDSDCLDLIGFVKWGFTYAFRHLRLQSSYEEAISDVLSMGGDTDTNAAIVGGLMGALHGASGIPRYMKEPVLARDSNSPGIPRQDFLTTRTLPEVCRQLYELAGQGAGMNALPVSHAAIVPGGSNCGSCFIPSVRRLTRNAAS
ncbi:TPA: hypothetical protein ACH3X2_007620 [Trebouxia sp. C0005]